MKPHTALQIWLDDSTFDGVLITKPENIGYLTGFWGSFGVYMQTAKGRYLLTDGRYAEVAQQLSELHGFTFIQYQGGVPEAFVEPVSGAMAVEDSLTLAQLKQYKKWFKGVKLKPQSGVVERLRKVKSATELGLMRAAQNHVDEMLVPFLQANLATGITERALKFRLDQALQHEGKYGLSFDSIVAFGPGSALPHYNSADRPLEPGYNILIDCGVIHQRYCSDMTRNFVWGEPSPEYMGHYEALLKAQIKTIPKVKAGVKAKAVDVFCRKQLGDLAEAFTHSLGHGVGLEVHEAPTLSTRSKDTLQAGEVVTVEPGLYYPGAYGIRIEDNVMVTNGAPEILTHTTKSLLNFNEKGQMQSVVVSA